MSEVLHANIFFLITSVAVVLCTILVGVILYQVIRILQSLRRVVDKIEAGSELIAEDIASLRNRLFQGSLISQVIGFFLGQKSTARQSRSRKGKTVINEEGALNDE